MKHHKKIIYTKRNENGIIPILARGNYPKAVVSQVDQNDIQTTVSGLSDIILGRRLT